MLQNEATNYYRLLLRRKEKNRISRQSSLHSTIIFIRSYTAYLEVNILLNMKLKHVASLFLQCRKKYANLLFSMRIFHIAP